MAVDYFLKIEGSEGESKDKTHANEIDILSWSWGESQLGSFSGAGGGGAGKVNMQDFNFTMFMNKAMPKLVQACASGQHIPSATLTCRKAGKEQQEYLKITFSDLLISSYQTGGSSGSEIPIDSIAFNYTKVKFEYKEQKPDGTLGGVVPAGWNLKENVAC